MTEDQRIARALARKPHVQKMLMKKARRDSWYENDAAHFARQLAKGVRIKRNFSKTPGGKPRTRNPIYNGVEIR